MTKSRNAAFHALQANLPIGAAEAIIKRCERESCWPDDIIREVFARGWTAPRFCAICGQRLQERM